MNSDTIFDHLALSSKLTDPMRFEMYLLKRFKYCTFQAQIRQEMDRLAQEFKGQSVQSRKEPSGHVLEAKRTIQETENYLSQHARSNIGTGRRILPKLDHRKRCETGDPSGTAANAGAAPEYYLVTTHLLPLSCNVIPDALPVPLETEWSQLEEVNKFLVDENGPLHGGAQNQSTCHKRQTGPPRRKSHLPTSRFRR